jgi:alkanesulfonate monooxygenase SsuD/methylene tetrahydromethanopterin reductase-like flavin-dependent oxidoreductase (luciferase family)
MVKESVKIGILLPTREIVMASQGRPQLKDWSKVVNMARYAEDSGIDSVWVGDSLVSKPRLEPITVLAALASCTKRVEIGTAVLLPALRNPVTLAHSLATLDIISGGRLILAMGVGGAFNSAQRQDWVAAGFDPDIRLGRMLETIQIMKRLWTDDHISFDGVHFTLNDITLNPKPVQHGGPRILLGTHFRTGSDSQYRRVSKYADGIMGITDSPGEFRDVYTKVRDLTGSQPFPAKEKFQTAFYMTVNIGDDEIACTKEATEFLERYYSVNHWGDRWGPWGRPGQIVDRMVEYHGSGVEHLVIRFASWNQDAQLKRFIREVVPAFRAVICS